MGPVFRTDFRGKGGGGRVEERVYTVLGPVDAEFVLITDFHEGDPQPVLSLLREHPPDLILLAGDTLERHARGSRPMPEERKHSFLDPVYRLLAKETAETGSGREFLRALCTIAPTLMSIGNHEWYLEEDDQIAVVLDNMDILWHGLRIGGLSSWYDEKWLEAYRRKDGYRILLCHQPEYCDRFHLSDFDLVLSGHAHGGQIRLFGRGLYAPSQGFLPKYTRGRYGNMIVSAGCANTARIPRLFNPPEIVRIKMHKT